MTNTVAGGARVKYGRLLRLTTALLWATPWLGFAYTVLFVLSQVALLAALLLPWKLLTVLATGVVPGFISQMWPGVTVKDLVFALGGGAYVAFGVFGGAELLMARVARSGSQAILARNDKVVLFDGYEKHAAALFRNFLRAFAAASATVLIGLGLLWLYPLLLLCLLSYLGLGWAYLERRSSPLLEESDGAVTPGVAASAWWSIGFIYAMAWVIFDYWFSTLPAMLTVFMCLLMLRQALVLCGLVYRVHGLFARQLDKAEALFLRDVPWQASRRASDDFLRFAERDQRQVWVGDVLKDLVRDPNASVSIVECTSSDNGHVLTVVVRCESSNRVPAAYLLRLFHASKKSRALHEQEMLQHARGFWPAPLLVAAHKLQGHSCLVYAWDSQAQLMEGAARRACLPALRTALLACEPPKALVARYARSRRGLVERLDAVRWSELESVVLPSAPDICMVAQQFWPALCDAVRRMPGQVLIPNLHSYRIDQVGDKLLLRNWSNWLWEPVGAGWPVRTTVEEFDLALRQARLYRPELQAVGGRQARLMALAFEFERLWRAQMCVGAVQLLPEINVILADA